MTLPDLAPAEYLAAYLAPSFTSADRPETPSRLNDAQKGHAVTILRMFTEAGLPARVAIAAVVNSYAESRLRADLIATEKSGHLSVGLFQLYSLGAGAGMTVAERKNPERNTERIIEEVLANEADVVNGTTTPAEASWAFCYFVERPEHPSTKANIRRRMCTAMFPELANLSDDLPRILLPGEDVEPAADEGSWGWFGG